MGNQETQNSKDTIQKQIIAGRRVVLKKENETLFVRIRFNNLDTDGSEKWRILVMGYEFHTSEIFIKCETRTLSEKFEEIGDKHHIVCDAKEIEFLNNMATIK